MQIGRHNEMTLVNASKGFAYVDGLLISLAHSGRLSSISRKANI